MKGKNLKRVLLFLSGVLIFGCAAPQFKPEPFTPQQFDAQRYAAKVETFLVLFDASSSMTRGVYNGTPKINIAKSFVHRMNQTIPELNMRGGLRSFGEGGAPADLDTRLIYGLTDYTTAGLAKALDEIQGHGATTPMEDGIAAAGQDLEATRGPIALIIVSDGEEPDENPIAAAQALKEKYGDRLCIYTVGIGDDRSGLNRLQRIADIGRCGFYSSADDLQAPGAVADFVEKVFLAPKPQAAAPPPPPPAPMPPPAPTPPPAPVLPLDTPIHFEFDRYNIQDRDEPVLNRIAEAMAQNPEVRIRIHGHTDAVGTAEYNQRLSERRAAAAKQYLVEKGINPDRIDTVGHGFQQPVATNETEQGRAQNRRDEFEQAGR